MNQLTLRRRIAKWWREGRIPNLFDPW